MTALKKIKQTLPSRIFNIYKPVGLTSFDVIKHFKRNLPKGYGKIGHFGTLDPFAEGVLLIATGKSPRLNNYFQENDEKVYEATGHIGVKTPSGDCTCDESVWTSQDVNSRVISKLTKENIEKIVQEQFIDCEYWQRPPAFSAAKFEGKALYEYAREGVVIEKDPILRKVYSFKVLEINFPEIRFEICVGSGTYIRSFFEDLSEKFETIGHLKTLKRTRVGRVDSDKSILQSEWPIRDDNFDFLKNSISPVEGLSYPQFDAPSDNMSKILNGMAVSCENPSLEGSCWLTCNNRLMALGEVSEGELRIKILFDEDLSKI